MAVENVGGSDQNVSDSFLLGVSEWMSERKKEMKRERDSGKTKRFTLAATLGRLASGCFAPHSRISTAQVLRPFWTALSQGLTEGLKASAPVPQTRTTLTPDIPRGIRQKLPSVGIYLVWLLLLPCKRRKPLHSLVCPQHRAGDKKELLLMLSSFSRVRLCTTP